MGMDLKSDDVVFNKKFLTYICSFAFCEFSMLTYRGFCTNQFTASTSTPPNPPPPPSFPCSQEGHLNLDWVGWVIKSSGKTRVLILNMEDFEGKESAFGVI